VERSGDYFGATVNLAARVAAYAHADQILCTKTILEGIQSLAMAEIHSVGNVSFKNVAQPVAIFEIEDAKLSSHSHEIDPVCRMALDPNTAPAKLPLGKQLYYFCSFECAQKFALDPKPYLLH
jgi:YHS domain-containing protein